MDQKGRVGSRSTRRDEMVKCGLVVWAVRPCACESWNDGWRAKGEMDVTIIVMIDRRCKDSSASLISWLRETTQKARQSFLYLHRTRGTRDAVYYMLWRFDIHYSKTPCMPHRSSLANWWFCLSWSIRDMMWHFQIENSLPHVHPEMRRTHGYYL